MLLGFSLFLLNTSDSHQESLKRKKRMPELCVEHFFHKASWTCTFVVYYSDTKDAVVIDSVMDLDNINWQTSLEHNQLIIDFVKSKDLKVHYILDSHVHADHITGGAHLSKVFGVPYAIGDQIKIVQKNFAALFNLPDFVCNGSQFGKLIADGEVLVAGAMKITCWNTPGHTPACMAYLVDDAVFTGDALFIEDYGCGRCDFPGGSASKLWDSVQRIYSLPDETRVFVGHDYQPDGRELIYQTTVGSQKKNQCVIPSHKTKEDFVKWREEIDQDLDYPRLIFPALRVNINGGKLPEAESGSNTRFLKIPLNSKQPTNELSEKQ
jgi:glyoxylase-like metal-dependent hydrolase (beta-lactamase superfamily II)